VTDFAKAVLASQQQGVIKRTPVGYWATFPNHGAVTRRSLTGCLHSASHDAMNAAVSQIKLARDRRHAEALVRQSANLGCARGDGHRAADRFATACAVLLGVAHAGAHRLDD
jgi:hypothetical protein